MAQVKQTEARRWKKGLRKVVLAGMGAAALARDGASETARKCVRKGEELEPGLKKILHRLAQQQKSVVQKVGKVTTAVDQRLQGWTKRIPVVTRRDFSELVQRIDVLTVKIDALASRKKSR